MSTSTQRGLERTSSSSAMGCPLCGGLSVQPWLQAPDRFHGRTTLYELVRCSTCDLVWLLDPPTPEEMSFHYDRNYHELIENAGETEIERRWHRERSTILSLK